MIPVQATLVLMNETITAAQTATTKTAVTGIARARAIALYCVFTYGSSGTSAKVWVQTTFDGGTTWVDIANFAHATTSLTRAYNLSAMTPLTSIYTATDGSLADNTCKDGLIGDQVRVKFTSTGTYAGTTTCQVWAVAKG
jgi:hypothetical protein